MWPLLLLAAAFVAGCSDEPDPTEGIGENDRPIDRGPNPTDPEGLPVPSDPCEGKAGADLAQCQLDSFTMQENLALRFHVTKISGPLECRDDSGFVNACTEDTPSANDLGVTPNEMCLYSNPTFSGEQTAFVNHVADNMGQLSDSRAPVNFMTKWTGFSLASSLDPSAAQTEMADRALGAKPLAELSGASGSYNDSYPYNYTTGTNMMVRGAVDLQTRILTITDLYSILAPNSQPVEVLNEATGEFVSVAPTDPDRNPIEAGEQRALAILGYPNVGCFAEPDFSHENLLLMAPFTVVSAENPLTIPLPYDGSGASAESTPVSLFTAENPFVDLATGHQYAVSVTAITSGTPMEWHYNGTNGEE
jgi:hypothetical protein